MTFGCSDPAYRDWLAGRPLPEELTGFLLENALGGEASFDGLGGMWTPESVMGLNDQESSLPACGLLGVGSAVNGDFLVVDFAKGDGESGFVSHDLLWERNRGGDARLGYVPAARSIGKLLHGLTAIDGFPMDYDSAKRSPLMYDADRVKNPSGPCLGNTAEDIEEFIYLVRGQLIDHPGIEAALQWADELGPSPWDSAESRRIDFAEHAHEWDNDMQTVVFEFRRKNLGFLNVSLRFAQELLSLAPTRFQWLATEERIYARIHWDRRPETFGPV